MNFTDRSDGQPDTWNWTFEGGTPATSTAQNPTVTYNQAGNFQVTLEASNSFGSDSKTVTQLIGVELALPIPYTQGFDGDFPPTNWIINNPDGNLEWQKISNAGNGNPPGCMIMNNADNATVGAIDEITMQGLNLQWMQNVAMTFDVGYTKFDNNSPDVLRVYGSSDCGSTWTELYQKTHTDLETVSGVSNPNGWVPSQASDWRQENVDLSAFDNEPFRFN